MTLETSPGDTAFPDAIRHTEAGKFVIDGSMPPLAVAPGSVDEVASVLRTAQGDRLALIVAGGRTQLSYGMPPSRYNLAVDVSALNSVVEYVPADLTITVEAGIRLEALQAQLAEHGQWLRYDPVALPDATIGGLLATNASGPGRIAYGSLRDVLIGIRFVTAGGEVIHSGGRVVKNVAGYDLGKLMIGSLGTLGAIVETTFKVAPLPARRNYFAVDAPAGNAEALIELAQRLATQGLAVDGIVFTQPYGAAGRLLVRLTGSQAAVERSERDLRAIAADSIITEADDATWSSALHPLLSEAVVARCGMTRSRVAGFLRHLPPNDAGGVVGYPAAGVIYLYAASVTSGAVQGLRVEAERLGGSLVIERAPLGLKAAAGVWGTDRADIGLMRAIKAELDPAGVLSPGRFVGGI